MLKFINLFFRVHIKNSCKLVTKVLYLIFVKGKTSQSIIGSTQGIGGIFTDQSTEEIIINPTEDDMELQPKSEDEFQPAATGGRKGAKKDSRGKSKNRK